MTHHSSGIRRSILVAALAVPLLLLALFYWRSPPAMPRTEIYRGVYLTVEDRSEVRGSGGKLMVVEVHWDTQGVRLANRPFTYAVSSADLSGPHYALVNADWALMKSGASLLVNTTLYHPDAPLRSAPGAAVRSLETVIVDGVTSHVDPNSYLLYWDRSMAAHVVQTKPPPQEDLGRAVLGFGLQGIQVSEGRPRYGAISNREDVYPRTFIGIDPEVRVLYLMAFEEASAQFMIDRAVAAGVVFGGQVDSGSSSNLIIGEHARGVRPHVGIRHWRPLGSYLAVYAESLD